MKPRNLQADTELVRRLRSGRLTPWVEHKLVVKLQRAMPYYLRETDRLRRLNDLQELSICRQREELADKRLELTAVRLALSIAEKAELRPAAKFVGSSIFRQWLQLFSEFGAVTVALLAGRHYDAGEELTDLQVSATTLLQILGFDAANRRWFRGVVNAKNRERGYDNG